MILETVIAILREQEKRAVDFGMQNPAPNKEIELLSYCLQIVAQELMELKRPTKLIPL